MDYWEKRAALRQAEVDKVSRELCDRVQRVFQKTEARATSTAMNILHNFMRAFGLKESEAKDILSIRLTRKEYEELAARIIEMPNCPLKKKFVATLSAEAYRYRIDRATALKMSVQAIYAECAEQTVDITMPDMLKISTETRMRTAYDIQHKVKFGYQVDSRDTALAKMALREKWMGESFSARVWQNVQKMGEDVADTILQFATTGEISTGEFGIVADNALVNGMKYGELNEKMLTLIEQHGYQHGMERFTAETGLDKQGMADIRRRARYAADRLIVTETNYIAGQATLEAYRETGLDRYIYSAILDSHTCGKNGKHESCQALDQRVFYIKDQRVGENMHPMHPWCRCTSKPYMDGYDTGRMQRAAMREDGTTELVPASMTYEQWAAWQKAGRPVSAKEWMTGKPDRRKPKEPEEKKPVETLVDRIRANMKLTTEEMDDTIGDAIDIPYLKEHFENYQGEDRNAGLKGAHRLDTFDRALKRANGQITAIIKHKNIEGVITYEYKLPQIDMKTGKRLSTYRKAECKKTVYSPNSIQTEEWIQRGLQAAMNCAKEIGGLDKLQKRRWEGLDDLGVKWEGYYKKGKITTMYPVIEKTGGDKNEER